MQVIAADPAPPVTTVFVWGVFRRRGTAQAALTTLIFGFTMGAAAFVVDMPLIGDQKLLTDVWGVPFLMQAFLGTVLCSVVFVVVSLLTPPPAPEKVEGLTWEHPLQVISHPLEKGRTDPRFIALALLGLMLVLYYFFR